MPVIDSTNGRISSAHVYNGLKLLESVSVVALASPDSRVTVMFVILVVSMIAVSFPTASSNGLIRVPNELFFIGKHFGTGVILATAFIHLLPDSFSALLDASVEQKYGNVGKWTGLIILGSLLTIFLVEYVSTTFVDRLHAEPSAPSTPRPTSRPPLTPLPSSTLLLQDPSTLLPFLANTPKIMRLHLNSTCMCRNGLCVCVPEPESAVPSQLPVRPLTPHEHSHIHNEHHHEETHKVGRRRQVVGIFVLQVGIMIHSLVIGLTLSITSGADFTSLTTAIIFHQIFEGLSLGIRIAALSPPVQTDDHGEEDQEADGHVRVQRAPSISALEGFEGIAIPKALNGRSGRASVPPLILHLDGGEESSSSSPQTLVVERPPHDLDSKPHRSHSDSSSGLDWRGWGSLFRRSEQQPLAHHHNGYGSTSHGPTEQRAERKPEWDWRPNPLKATLSILFAVTTPFGMALGLTMWQGKDGAIDPASMKLIQGVMSAISAGMLIYAATVEMIAGDFVFGDLEGHHHHHGGGGHDHDHEHAHENGNEEHAHHQPSIGKRATAVLSLFLGVAAMVLIGLGEH